MSICITDTCRFPGCVISVISTVLLPGVRVHDPCTAAVVTPESRALTGTSQNATIPSRARCHCMHGIKQWRKAALPWSDVQLHSSVLHQESPANINPPLPNLDSSGMYTDHS